jgi:ribosomal protein L24
MGRNGTVTEIPTLEDDYDNTDEGHSTLYRSITQADEDEDENENDNIVSKWQQMARRLQWHSSAREYQSDEDIGYQLQNTDMLWEIGCRVSFTPLYLLFLNIHGLQIGEEETIPFKVLQRACHPSTPEVLASSIVATPIPGRIYAEVTGFAQATKLARSLAELDPLRISLVPREDIPKILNFASSRHVCQQWARVGGKKKKWHWYQGDTGLIEKVEGSRKKYLALIPRLVLEDVRGGQSRPRQALVERAVLEVQVGLSLVEDDEHGRFIWNKQTFSAEGLLLVDLDDIDILPLLETLPSSAELAVFRSTSLLSTETAVQTDRMIIQTRMNIGDRVKVMVGTYLGMLGNVVEMKENEVTVYLPSQDIIEDMLQDSVRAAFDIGDQVVVVDGERKGLVGWVIGISADRIRVLNIQDNIEVNLPYLS